MAVAAGAAWVEQAVWAGSGHGEGSVHCVQGLPGAARPASCGEGEGRASCGGEEASPSLGSGSWTLVLRECLVWVACLSLLLSGIL